MKMFTIYYRYLPSFASVDARGVDLTLYTAKVEARSESDAVKKFKSEYMKPSFVKSLKVGKRKTREITKKVPSSIKIVRVFSGDGRKYFTSFAGTRKYRKQMVGTVAKTRKPRWMW